MIENRPMPPARPLLAAPRRGRPRAVPPRRGAAAPEDEILVAAGRLFAKQGFAATSTRQIAAAAGLRQPSLFHWFASKDAILDALLEKLLAPPLAYAAALEARHEPAALSLYRFLRFDVFGLCTAPYDVGALAVLPELRAPRFRGFWREREQLVAAVEGWIRRGIREGDFAPIDPALAARALFGLDEATLSWFRARRDDPAEVAEGVATLALRALLADPRALAELRAAASRSTD
jgi:AcrR family transcriptional regulator